MDAPQPSAAQQRDIDFLRANARHMTPTEREHYRWLAGDTAPQRAVTMPQPSLFDLRHDEAA